MKIALKWLAASVGLLVIIYMLGPAPSKPDFPAQLPKVSPSLVQLERDVRISEQSRKEVKANNQARIVWADSTRKQKTPYSMLYLHGFSASQEEGAPVHTDLARRFGCNLFLARLEDHGTQHPDVFLKLTVENMVASAQRALAIAEQLGDSVIVIGTSNGAALSLYLAATQPKISALAVYSPAIALYDPSTFLLDKPWGLQIARTVVGSDYIVNPTKVAATHQYWSTKYRLEGLVTLQSFLSNTMTPETFQRVHCPVFMAYYYKNEDEQDKVASVPAMLTMFDELATPTARKRKVAFPNAGEHVIASHLRSKDWQGVERETARFLEEVLRIKPAQRQPNNAAVVNSSLSTATTSCFRKIRIFSGYD